MAKRSNPLSTMTITSKYGYRTHPIQGGTKFHYGIDLGASTGTPVMATEAGEVVQAYAGTSGYGHRVFLKGNSGYYTLYAHMSKISVKQGDKVTKGAKIGEVGSTGMSTGPHLHFGVYKSSSLSDTESNTINPQDYLSGASTPSGDATTDTTSYEDIDSDYMSSDGVAITPKEIYEEPTVTPRRVKDTGPQPMIPFVDIYVGTYKLTFKPPKYVMSLEFTRVGDSGSHFTLDLFDDKWGDLETLFSEADNYQNIQIRYGIVNGVSSKLYHCFLAESSIEMTSAGIILHLKGYSQGIVDNLEALTYDTGTTNPTEAVKSICKQVGWLVSDENFDPSVDVEFSNKDSITLIAEYPAEYIKYHLAPIAKRASDGASGYRFDLDNSTSPPTAYFKPVEVDTSKTNKTYVYMRGVDSPVLDLQLSIKSFGGGAGTTNSATEVESCFIDPDTKVKTTITKDINSVRVNTTGAYSHTRADQSKSIMDASGRSASQMNALVDYKLKRESFPYQGTLTILGDPDFTLGEYIRLIVLTDEGNMHYSSGMYFIRDIVDTISDGIMTTSLSILKTENIMSGTEIVNYRRMYK